MKRAIRQALQGLMPHLPIKIAVSRNGALMRIAADEFEAFPLEDGDELRIAPGFIAKLLHGSPDGSRHVPLRGGKTLQVPAKVEMFDYKGFRIPKHLILLTGAGSETLEPIGKAHIANYRKYMGLAPEMSILEIGCGIGRDALQFIDILDGSGRYVGVDVTRDSIAWCIKNITARHPNFTFRHFDARHELYNPLGTKGTTDFVLPAADRSVDRIVLGSIFTHLFEDEIVHYLSEISRVLRPSGRTYATFFLYSEETVSAGRKTDRTPFKLRFEHRFGDGCYVNDAENPTGAVAYTDEAMHRMIEKSGLALDQPFLKGWWSGAFDDAVDGQEVAILSLRNSATI